MHRQWLVQRTNPEYITYLASASGISPTLAQILINRGVKTPEEVALFRDQEMDSLSDPLEINGMQALVDAVVRARADGKKVYVHGDYDADGLTATSIMTQALRAMGLAVEYFIPNRFTDGYGFHPSSVERAASLGAGLIITVDCGITSFEAAEAARDAGIELVITDHHEPVAGPTGPRMPEAVAIINPKLPGNSPAVAGLCGAGVALKAAHAFEAAVPGSFRAGDFVDLAALGTLADSVPLTGENRTIVREGLQHIMDPRRPGLKALVEVAGLGGRSIKSGLIAFTLVPRINAAGRLSDAGVVVELFSTDSSEQAATVAASLGKLNTERQKVEEVVLTEAEEMLASAGGPGPAVVLAQEGWHEGVLGIVAARLAEKHQRPAFVLSIKDGVAKGSARSIPGMDIHAGLTECSSHLSGFGGHKQAAGLRLEVSELGAFREKMSAIAERFLATYTPTLALDAEVGLADVTFGLLKELESLEPFGYGNPEPVLGARGLEVMGPRVVGKNHLKLKLRAGNCAHDAIGWGMGGLLGEIESAGAVDAAFSPTINEWNGGRHVQLSIKALRPSKA